MHFEGVAGLGSCSLCLGQPLPFLTSWLRSVLAAGLFPQFVCSLDCCWAVYWYNVFVDKLQCNHLV